VIPATLLAVLAAACGGTPDVPLSEGSAIPQEAVVDISGVPPMVYTQDFQLQDCTFKPHGINPFYDPLVPGSRSVSVAQNAVDDEGNPVPFYKEYLVLSETIAFNLDGIGSFEAAVVEEKEFENGKQIQLSVNWYAICEQTNSVHSVGEDSFELDPDTGEVINTEGSWRSGTINTLGETATPSMGMPGTVMLGSRYIFDGAPGIALGGAEIVAVGLNTTDGLLSTVATSIGGYPGEADVLIPLAQSVGDFRGCVQIEEISQDNETRKPDLSDVTEKVWCPGVGLVYDTSDGALTESNALTDDAFIKELEKYK
jgi:hypothetical protein